MQEPKGNADFAIYNGEGGGGNATECSRGANGKSANQQHLATNVTLTEPKHPANNASLTAADKLS